VELLEKYVSFEWELLFGRSEGSIYKGVAMPEYKNVAILGAGNSGCAHAFKLSELGHKVSLIKTSFAMHDENFSVLQQNGGIWAEDFTCRGKKSFQKLRQITRDIKSGVQDADIIMVMTQSLQHEAVAKVLGKYVDKKTRLLLVIPGNLGSVFFKREIESKNIIVGEGESTPFDARIKEPGVVSILFKNVRNKLGFLPSSLSEAGISLANNLIETYEAPRTNVVESALHNPNLVVHTIGVIMSAARIEHTKGEFWMYREGFTPAIWNLIDVLDKEKNSVIEAYGGTPSSYLDECKYRNSDDLTIDSRSVFESYGKTGGPKGPSAINSRYLLEDVPNGLGLLSSLGAKANIPTPLSDSLILVASYLLNRDLKQEARTLERLGLESKTQQEVIDYVSF